MLVDTDVLIWHLRGLPKATQRLDRLSGMTVSAITWLELLQGFRNQTEMPAVHKSLDMRGAKRLPITPAITDRAIELMQAFDLSHGMRLGDALIAATAIEHGLTVLTGNVRHFSPVESLQIERFDPNG